MTVAIRKRERFCNLLKGFLILEVVWGHTGGGWWFAKWTYGYAPGTASFAYWEICRSACGLVLPLFFFIAGYFINAGKVNQSAIAFYKKRLPRLIVPFLAWSCVYSIINALIYGEMVTLLSVLLGSNGIQLYFMVVMVQLALLTPLLAKWIHRKTCVIICILLTLANSIVQTVYWMTEKQLVPQEMILFTCWIGYYAIGMYIRTNGVKPPKRLVLPAILTAVFLVIRIIESFWLLNQTGSAVVSISRNSLGNLLYSLAVIWLIFGIKDRVRFAEAKRPMERLGLACEDIFLVHWAILRPIEVFLYEFIKPVLPLPVIQLLELTVTLALCGVYVLIMKVCSRSFGRKDCCDAPVTKEKRYMVWSKRCTCSRLPPMCAAWRFARRTV